MDAEGMTAKLFVDANIFLEVALADKRAGECRAFFRKLLGGEIPAATSDFIVYTCILQIQRKLKSAKKAEEFVIFLSNIEHLEIIRPDLYTMKGAADLAHKYNLTFDDAMVVACTNASGSAALLSFDRDFDAIREVRRIEPNQL